MVAAVATALACAPPPPPGEDWIEVVNEYRAAAHLPPVDQDPAWNLHAFRHAEYMARTGVVGHAEDPSSPYYSVEGSQAGAQSNVASSSDVHATDRAFVEQWMTAPFHQIGILDPRLATVGYGVFRDPSTRPRATAVLNILAGLTGPAATGVVTFPGDGTSIRLRAFPGGEYPDPRTACEGYGRNVVGAPLLVLLPNGNETVLEATLSRAGQALELCRFDGTTYTAPDAAAQSLGRAILAARNGTVLLPRQPLDPGWYAVTVRTTARTLAWSFMVR